MEKFDLSAALSAYRKEKGYTIRKMANILGMSKSAYDRLERGITKPTYDQVPRILNLLQLEIDAVHIVVMEPEPTPPLKWNRPRKIHLLLPVIIALVFQSMFVEMRGFREGIGEEQIAAGSHFMPMLIIGAVFCAIYWFFLPPILPKRKPTRLEMLYVAAGAGVFLLLFFFEELVMPVLRWTGSYLDNTPAGLWIPLSFITALIALCIWGFRRAIMDNINNAFTYDKLFSNRKKIPMIINEPMFEYLQNEPDCGINAAADKGYWLEECARENFEYLFTWRKKAQMPPELLSKRVGIPLEEYHLIENGERTMTNGDAWRIDAAIIDYRVSKETWLQRSWRRGWLWQFRFRLRRLWNSVFRPEWLFG